MHQRAGGGTGANARVGRGTGTARRAKRNGQTPKATIRGAASGAPRGRPATAVRDVVIRLTLRLHSRVVIEGLLRHGFKLIVIVLIVDGRCKHHPSGRRAATAAGPRPLGGDRLHVGEPVDATSGGRKDHWKKKKVTGRQPSREGVQGLNLQHR